MYYSVLYVLGSGFIFIEQAFHLREESFSFVLSHFSQQGYHLKISHSNPDKNRFYFQCDRDGHTRNTRNLSANTRCRRNSSLRLNCQFKLYIRKLQSTGMFHLSLINGTHNHPPSHNPLAHPSARFLSEVQRQDAFNLSLAGINPIVIALCWTS
jgi:hypothetical protein